MARSDERATVLVALRHAGLHGNAARAVLDVFERRGLHVVTDADMRVLEAMGEIELGVLEAIRDKNSCAPRIFHPPCLAELARREEGKG